MNIRLKTKQQIADMRIGGRYLAEMLLTLKSEAHVGTQVLDLEKRAEELLDTYHVQPAFKGYQGFPSVICISLNQEVVHGIPRDYLLKAGDLLSLDFGLVYKHLYLDAALTCGIGSVSSQAQTLIDVAESSLSLGIKQAQSGNKIGAISHAIQQKAESHGFSVVRELVGHGVGFDVHEDPPVPNYGQISDGPVMRSGLVIAIEPMITAGSHQVTWLSDGWTVVTRDGSLSSHAEHTVAITDNGPEILTMAS